MQSKIPFSPNPSASPAGESRWGWIVRDLQGTGPLELVMMIGLNSGLAILLQYLAVVVAPTGVGMVILSLIPLLPVAAGLLYTWFVRPVVRAVESACSLFSGEPPLTRLPVLKVTFPQAVFPADTPPPRTHSA